MTTSEAVELKTRLRRACVRRLAVGWLLLAAVTVAGFTQPEPAYPPEVSAPPATLTFDR